jgi:carbamoyltransferase
MGFERASQKTVLGISASHNGAACILQDGKLVVAVQEERVSRTKRHRIAGSEPSACIAYCLAATGIEPKNLDAVVLSVQGRVADTIHSLERNPLLASIVGKVPFIRCSHHRAHAISAFATSGFDSAAVLVIDGLGSPLEDCSEAERDAHAGEHSGFWETTTLYSATRHQLSPLLKEGVPEGRWLEGNSTGLARFASVGGMYSAAAKFTFGDTMAAGKVMGLAAFGERRYTPDMFFRINRDRLEFLDEVARVLPAAEPWPADQDVHKDLAASVQLAAEEAILHYGTVLFEKSGRRRLCYAGGVALNCLANQRLTRESGFESLYIVPPAEDSGVAIGAACEGVHRLSGVFPTIELVTDECGRRYRKDQILTAITQFDDLDVSEPDKIEEATADALSNGAIIGWFQGGSELGPRALGHRSILATPRDVRVRDRLCGEIKRRELFRPFGASILREHASSWFEMETSDASPFMLRTFPVRPEAASKIPGAIHADGTSRLQTVTVAENALLHDVLTAFHRRTGIPLLINTSFNQAGEPIVETPFDALRCFRDAALDACVLGPFIVTDRRRSEAK